MQSGRFMNAGLHLREAIDVSGERQMRRFHEAESYTAKGELRLRCRTIKPGPREVFRRAIETALSRQGR